MSAQLLFFKTINWIFIFFVNEEWDILEYKYLTSLHRSSFYIINILAIFNHGISFEKPTWQRGDSNLFRRYLSIVMLSTTTFASTERKHQAQR